MIEAVQVPPFKHGLPSQGLDREQSGGRVPLGHMQLNEEIPCSTHSPLFWQGLGEQGEDAFWNWGTQPNGPRPFPVYPLGQTHDEPKIVGTHIAAGWQRLRSHTPESVFQLRAQVFPSPE